MVYLRRGRKSEHGKELGIYLLRLVAYWNISQRPHWIPYFDDVQAIIFLAPLAFNLMLEEDSKVNRLVSILILASSAFVSAKSPVLSAHLEYRKTQSRSGGKFVAISY